MNKVIKKICLLGDESVGKTSLTRRYVHNSFSEDYKSTIGVSLNQKSIQSADTLTHLMIWDLEGNREPSDFPKDYLDGAHASLVVADITRKQTLDKALKFAELFYNINRNAICVLALNKMDLLSAKDVEDKVNLIKSNKEINISMFSAIVPTSAKSNFNVEAIFKQLTGESND